MQPAMRGATRCVALRSEWRRVTASSREYFHSPRNATQRVAQRMWKGRCSCSGFATNPANGVVRCGLHQTTLASCYRFEMLIKVRNVNVTQKLCCFGSLSVAMSVDSLLHVLKVDCSVPHFDQWTYCELLKVYIFIMVCAYTQNLVLAPPSKVSLSVASPPECPRSFTYHDDRCHLFPRMSVCVICRAVSVHCTSLHITATSPSHVS